MVISFAGPGSFKIQTGGVTILTEEFSGEVSGRMKPDIFIKTTNSKSSSSAEHVIYGPGEYEIKDIEVKGLPNFVYLIKTEEMRLGFAGGEDADVLFIPDTADGAKLARQLHPKIIISSTGSCKELEKEFGKKAETADKLVIKKKEVPVEPLSKLICLKV